MIYERLRVYAKAEAACVIRGLALDQQHDSAGVRATSILASITGKISVKAEMLLFVRGI